MLKTRLMPTLLYKEFGLVKGTRFDPGRRVGSVMQAVKVYNLREVDELVFLDVAATREGREPDYELIDEIADECFMPLAVGGGIHSVEHVRKLLRVGADKVVVNTAAVERPALVREIASVFGSQAVVASIDVSTTNGFPEVVTRAGTHRTGRDAVACAKELVAAGAGELLVGSVDRDGTMEGYDLVTLRAIASVVDVPVIASGGAGSYEHMAAALEGGASAVAAGAIFHFTQQTPQEAKNYLRSKGVATRR